MPFSRESLRHFSDLLVCRIGLVALVIATVGAFGSETLAAEPAGAEPKYESEIAPLLKKHCARCHAGDMPKASFDVATPAGLLKGGESGAAVLPGRPDDSSLLQMVAAGDMPPEKDKRLSSAEIDLLRRWIASGAKHAGNASASGSLNQHDVLPILLLRCVACHGRQRTEGGFDVRSVASLKKGGKSGPAIVPGKPDESRLIQRIAAGEMPPKKELAAVSVKPVEPAELKKLRDWIEAGAVEVDQPPDVPNGAADPLVSDEERQFWSFQRLRPVSPPTIPRTDMQHARLNNPVDTFILARLRGAQLQLSPPADRLTLLRRVSVDLLGVPADPDVARRFLSDPDPLAYGRLVDELLASPRYGERWAQYWLDLCGYSDSEGVQDSDLVRPFAYRYRDYVIRSLNADKPYDRFLLEQLAGDELADYEHAETITPELFDNLAATGFLGMTADGTFAGITGFVPDRLDVIDDQLRVLGGSVLGLTIGCARCHSHKFDPFPQRDYYRLAAIFKGAFDEHDWLKPTRQPGAPGSHDRFLPFVPKEERQTWEAHEAAVNAKIDELKKQRDAAKDDAAQLKKLEAQIKESEKLHRPEPLVRAVWDRGEPSPTYILRRGNYLTPSKLVGPGVPSMLSDGRTPLRATPPWPDAKKTGLRLAFARWLTEPDHPLTARVMVNRVWKHHFGEGLVRTVDNFGRSGEPPSHPELLDWLANEFVRSGWSLKALHRLLLTSATYQQVSQVTAEQLERDPEQRLYSHFSTRRLDGETLHDHLWTLAGRLEQRPFGEPDPVTAHPDGLVVPAADKRPARRAIFLLQRRSQPLTLLADFDRPVMSPNCTNRTDSIVAPQALHLMNNAQVHQLAESLARRVTERVGADLQQQLEEVYWLACGRPPRPDEIDLALASVTELQAVWRRPRDPSKPQEVLDEAEAARRALANYCHAVLNSAAFLFVD